MEAAIATPGFGNNYPMGLTTPAKAAVVRPLRQPLFDTEFTGTAAITEIQYFQRAQGQSFANAGPGGSTWNKTTVDTNMTQGGFLASPAHFSLFGFNYEIQSGCTVADFQMLINSGLFEFIFAGTRVYLQIPLTQIPAGVAPEGFAAMDGATAATSTIHIHNGVGHVSNIYNFTLGRAALKIMPNEAFKCRVSWPRGQNASGQTAVTPVVSNSTRVYLRGLLFNSI
jgi:hypothetical protein